MITRIKNKKTTVKNKNGNASRSYNKPVYTYENMDEDPNEQVSVFETIEKVESVSSVAEKKHHHHIENVVNQAGDYYTEGDSANYNIREICCEDNHSSLGNESRFTEDDVLKGIIWSEILSKPKSIR